MKEVREITDFMDRVEKDSRLGPMHVSLYLAILYCWLRQGGAGPARVNRMELMSLAKICGRNSVYKFLRELHDYGYIEYHASFRAGDRHKVYLPLLEKMGYQWKD